jgi:polyhydroxyalkanoate synthesis repressor PhaR
MHRIKKYSNRKLYDTATKSFITMDDIANLVESGEEIIVIDNSTGEDITTTILSQLVSKNLSGNIQDEPSEVLTGLLRKGGGEFFNYARKKVGLLHRAATLTSGGIDKIENLITVNKDNADPDEEVQADDDTDQADNEAILQESELIKWITGKIDEGIKQSLKKSNLATKKQIAALKKEVKELTARVEMLEK